MERKEPEFLPSVVSGRWYVPHIDPLYTLLVPELIRGTVLKFDIPGVGLL